MTQIVFEFDEFDVSGDGNGKLIKKLLKKS